MSGHPGERLSAFLDGELPVSERAEVAAHIRECAECARQVEELSAVDALARELRVDAPEGYFDALPARVRARVRRRPRLLPVAVWAAAAAAVLVAVVAPLTLQRTRSLAPSAAERMAEQGTAVPPATVTSAYATPAPAVSPALRAAGARPDFSLPTSAPAEEARARRDVPSGRLAQRDRAQNAMTAPRAAPALAATAPEPERLHKAVEAHGKEVAQDAAATAPPPPPPAAARPAPAPDAFAAGAAAGKTEDEVGATRVGSRDEGVPAAKGAEAARRGTAPARERKPVAAGRVLAETDPAILADRRYQALLDRRPASVAEARALRDGWEAFARDRPADARADEARVRALEAAITAWRLGSDPADLARARALGRDYLGTEDAPQRDRVRALLDALPPAP